MNSKTLMSIIYAVDKDGIIELSKKKKKKQIRKADMQADVINKN